MSRFDVKSFSSIPDPELICGICMNVLDDPKETPCRHVFCNLCITTALETRERCPMCRARCDDEKLRPVLPLVQNLLNKLPMRCKNYRKGKAGVSCNQIIRKELYLDHLEKCEFAYVDCPNSGCKARVMRKDKKSHMKSCEHRSCVCRRGCQASFKWKDRMYHSCVKTLKDKVDELETENFMLRVLFENMTKLARKRRPAAGQPREPELEEERGELKAKVTQLMKLAMGDSYPHFRGRRYGWTYQEDTDDEDEDDPVDDTPPHRGSATHSREENHGPAGSRSNVSSTSMRSSPADDLGSGRRQSALGPLGFGSRANTDVGAGGSTQAQGGNDMYASYGPPVVDMDEEDVYANYGQDDLDTNDASTNGRTQRRDPAGRGNDGIMVNITPSPAHSPDPDEPSYDSYGHYGEDYDSLEGDVDDSCPATPWPYDEDETEEGAYLEGGGDHGCGDDRYDDYQQCDTEQGNEHSTGHGGLSAENRFGHTRNTSDSEEDYNTNRRENELHVDSRPDSSEAGSHEPVLEMTSYDRPSSSSLGHRRSTDSEAEQEDQGRPSKRRRVDGNAAGSVGAGPVGETSDSSNADAAPDCPGDPDASAGERRRSTRLQGLAPPPSTIPNVPVPLSTAQLLQLYNESEDESEDPSWDSESESDSDDDM